VEKQHKYSLCEAAVYPNPDTVEEQGLIIFMISSEHQIIEQTSYADGQPFAVHSLATACLGWNIIVHLQGT